MKTLILMVGLPRSGKTTKAWKLSERHSAPVVNPDSIHRVLHGTAYRDEANPIVWGIAKMMVRALFEAGHEFVILDACNNTIARREEWKDPTGLIWDREYFYLDTSMDECIRRLDDSNQELADVIRVMSVRHEPLDDDEQEDEI